MVGYGRNNEYGYVRFETVQNLPRVTDSERSVERLEMGRKWTVRRL